MDEFLIEAKRLYDLQFAVHWLLPNSKRPVKKGWTKGSRESWDKIKADYRPGMGLGVRLGAISELEDGCFLANIDIDVKSALAEDRKWALASLEHHFPGLRGTAPEVKTGTGLRLFVKTVHPLESRKIDQSDEPRSDGNGRAWEIELMSIGRQVVLPPTIHPDTQKPYVWRRPLLAVSDIPKIDVAIETRKPGRPSGTKVLSDFEPEEIELYDLDQATVDLLCDEDSDDRSVTLFSACMALVKQGFSDNQILTILTDKNLPLGRVGYDEQHTGSRSRKVVARWIQKYTLQKVKHELSAENVFSKIVSVEDNFDDDEPLLLSPEDTIKQKKEIADDNWKLERKSSKEGALGPPLKTLSNLLYIFQKEIHPELFRRDLFKVRDVFGVDAPWGRKKGTILVDEDALLLKEWLMKTYKFEPPVGLIEEAIVITSVKNAFHPIKERLERAEPWDGTTRLDTGLARYLDAEGDPEYLAQVFRKLMVAAVSRIYQPGTKFDWALILEGPQNLGKSRFGELLFGTEFFTDWLPKDLSDKETMVTLEGNWCIELSELGFLNKTALRDIKSFITRKFDKFRKPFAKRLVELGRQCVFIGTTNEDQYLQDETGNRRFMPVKVNRLNEKALLDDLPQLWAEALFLYQWGLEPRLYLDAGAQAFAVAAQEEKRILSETDIMARDMLDFIEDQKKKPNNERLDFTRFRLKDLFQGEPFGSWDWRQKSTQMNAARALKKIGAKKHHGCDGKYWSLDLDMPDKPSKPKLEIIKN
jgi:hypothetical protein